MKSRVKDLALYGGSPVFREIRSTSNLVAPDFDRFLQYVKQSYDAGWLTNNGPMVKLMEQRLARMHGTSECVATCNGLWALVLCIDCLALESKSEIVMPSLTYRRMADIAAWLKMVPHFCDVDRQTLGITARTVEPCINDNTALILAAHPIVNLCDIDSLCALSQERGIPLLIDSVEAAYASHNGAMIGSFGNAEVFSMHASKLINAFEAGYITTNDSQLAAELRRMRGFGYQGPDNVESFGLNAKLNEVHAAMALAGLDDLPDQVERNRGRYRAYEHGLNDVDGISLVEYLPGEIRGFKNILVRLNEDWPISRQLTLDILHAENMLARPYYSPPLHDKDSVYATVTGEMSVTNELKSDYLLLPSGEFVSLEDVDQVVVLLRSLQMMGEEINRYQGSDHAVRH